MKMIRHHTTLFYYDGVQIFEARDEIGGHYIAVLVESDRHDDRYLVAGVEPERLRRFRCGMLDLRSLLVERAEKHWYLGKPGGDVTAPLEVKVQRGPLAESDLLPEAGFILHQGVTPSEGTIDEARARNSLVLAVAFEPPESASEHRIRTSTLASSLILVQRMVTYAYRVSRRICCGESQGMAAPADVDAHLLDVVVPAAPGSFRVLFAPAIRPNMFGQHEVQRALNCIDNVLEVAHDPQMTSRALNPYRGHFVGAYLNLLRLLIQAKSNFRYSWAEPDSSTATVRSVSGAQAAPLVDHLDRETDLSREIVTLEGKLDELKVSKGSWRLVTDHGGISGKTAENEPSLNERMSGRKYRFTCIEEIKEHWRTGRERRVYLVTDIQEIHG